MTDPLAAVAVEVERVFASIEPLRALAAEGAELGALRRPAAELLRRHEGFTAGAGVVFAPGAVAGADRWIEWWWADRGGGIERLQVDLDSSSAEFYDYTTAEWYRLPEQTGRAAIAGPYVDYICTHEYTFTLAVPVLRDGRFLGVAGADVLAEQVEQAVLPALARCRRATVLATAEGRVIASNDAAYAPGVVVPGGFEPVASRAALPWRLLEAA